MKQKNISNTLNVAIGNKLRIMRLTRGMSQKELASAIGISFQQLQKYERGVNRLSVEMLIKITRYMGINPVEIMVTDSDEEALFENFVHTTHPDQLQLMQHYSNITDPEKRKTVVKIAQWLI